jgi:hypothetical protein
VAVVFGVFVKVGSGVWVKVGSIVTVTVGVRVWVAVGTAVVASKTTCVASGSVVAVLQALTRIIKTRQAEKPAHRREEALDLREGFITTLPLLKLV